MIKYKNLYIHIPFCTKICTYCDFYKMVASEVGKVKYIDYLIKELDLKKELIGSLETIYIGGGTPSCLDINLLDKLFSNLNKYIDPNTLKEYTIEANPNDISISLAHLFKKHSINRVSLGVQGLKEDKLNILGRTHNKADVLNAIQILQDANITNISVDLIYGVGNEKFKDIKEDLKILLKTNIKHLSLYSLILEDKTILKKLYNENKFKLYDEDEEAKLYIKITEFLKKEGFIHYEISNFAKENYESLHNLVYWNNNNYLGLGPSASYYLEDIRYTNIRNLNKYYQGIDNKSLIYEEKIKLTIEEQMSEELIMGLRKIKGINLNNFKTKFNKDIFEVYPVINQLINNKLLKIENDFLFIPEDKLYLSNEVFIKFI